MKCEIILLSFFFKSNMDTKIFFLTNHKPKFKSNIQNLKSGSYFTIERGHISVEGEIFFFSRYTRYQILYKKQKIKRITILFFVKTK